jgi:hypothetical protein
MEQGDPEDTLRLVIRQLRDIQAQADKILTGDNSSEAIEGFARYSTELKNFISKHYDYANVQAYLTELPKINYAKTQVKLWQYLLLPSWWISLYHDYRARNKAMDAIRLTKDKYATLTLLLKGL